MEYTPTSLWDTTLNLQIVFGLIGVGAIIAILCSCVYILTVRIDGVGYNRAVVVVALSVIIGLVGYVGFITATLQTGDHNRQQVDEFINKLETHYQVTIPETTIREWFPKPSQGPASFEQAAQKPPVTTTLTYHDHTINTNLILRQPEPGVWELYGTELTPLTELLETNPTN